MAKRLKTFCFLLAAVMGMSLVLSACGGEKDPGKTDDPGKEDPGTTTETVKHEHIWNDGSVTTAPTCTSSGVKTYACTVSGCTVTRNEFIPATHRWVAQDDNRLPSLYTDGSAHYICSVCKTEKSETVKAHADFSEQFYTNISGATDWLYGYVQNFNASAATLNFARITSVKDSETALWAADGVEIGKDYVKSEKNAAIGFKFAGAVPVDVTANATISFVGSGEKTNLDAHLLWTDQSGKVNQVQELNKDGKKDWNFTTAQAYEVKQGDIFYLVFSNKGDAKDAAGSLTFTVSAPCVHIWDDGEVKKEVSCKQEGQIERTCLTCGVKFTDTVAKLPHTFENEGQVTKEASCTEEGTLEKTCTKCQETVTEILPKTPHNYVEDIQLLKPATTAEDGLATYKCSKCQDVYTQKLAKKVDGQVADFAREFTTGIQREWQYGYGDWNWGENKYNFTQATNKNNEAWLEGGGIEIKGGWMRNEEAGKHLVVRYKVQQTQTVQIVVRFKGSNADETGMSGRLHIMKPDGTTQQCDLVYDFAAKDTFGGSTANWTHTVKATVEKDSYIAVFFWNEKGGWCHGELDFTIYEENAELPFVDTAAVTDFQARGQNENGWEYGYINSFNFSDNTFEFKQLEGHDGNEAADPANRRWYLPDQWVEFFRTRVVSDHGGDAAIRYTMSAAETVNITVRFRGAGDKTRLAGRLHIQNPDGTVKSCDYIFDANSNSWEKTLEKVELEKGAKITLIFFRENGSEDNSGIYDFKITKA